MTINFVVARDSNPRLLEFADGTTLIQSGNNSHVMCEFAGVTPKASKPQVVAWGEDNLPVSQFYLPEVFVLTKADTNSGFFTHYAFDSYAALRLFQRLLELDGVGPKKALESMRKAGADAFKAALTLRPSALVLLPGLPPKAKQSLQLLIPKEDAPPKEVLNEDAVAALKALGKSAAEARDLVIKAQRVNPTADAGELVKLALKR